MFRRNVDFFAVFLIALAMIAVSQARAFRVPIDAFQVQNIGTNFHACPEANQALARIASLLNQ